MFRFEEENQLASKCCGEFSGAGCRRQTLQGWTSNETQSDQRQAGVGAVHGSRAERQAAVGCCPEFEVCSYSLHNLNNNPTEVNLMLTSFLVGVHF